MPAAPKSTDGLSEENQRLAALKEVIIAFRLTFTTQSGEKVMNELKRFVEHGEGAYKPGSTSPNAALDAAFLSGAQAVISHIYAVLRTEPEEPKES